MRVRPCAEPRRRLDGVVVHVHGHRRTGTWNLRGCGRVERGLRLVVPCLPSFMARGRTRLGLAGACRSVPLAPVLVLETPLARRHTQVSHARPTGRGAADRAKARRLLALVTTRTSTSVGHADRIFWCASGWEWECLWRCGSVRGGGMRPVHGRRIFVGALVVPPFIRAPGLRLRDALITARKRFELEPAVSHIRRVHGHAVPSI